MAKRKKAKSQAKPLDTAKQISSEQVSTRYFVGEVEYCSLSEALRRSEVGNVLGYPERFTYAGTAVYGYLRHHSNTFTSYIKTESGRPMYPASEISELITRWIAMYSEKVAKEEATPATPTTATPAVSVSSPELAELLTKLSEKPELVRTILEIVA